MRGKLFNSFSVTQCSHCGSHGSWDPKWVVRCSKAGDYYGWQWRSWRPLMSIRPGLLQSWISELVDCSCFHSRTAADAHTCNMGRLEVIHPVNGSIFGWQDEIEFECEVWIMPCVWCSMWCQYVVYATCVCVCVRVCVLWDMRQFAWECVRVCVYTVRLSLSFSRFLSLSHKCVCVCLSVFVDVCKCVCVCVCVRLALSPNHSLSLSLSTSLSLYLSLPRARARTHAQTCEHACAFVLSHSLLQVVCLCVFVRLSLSLSLLFSCSYLRALSLSCSLSPRSFASPTLFLCRPLPPAILPPFSFRLPPSLSLPHSTFHFSRSPRTLSLCLSRKSERTKESALSLVLSLFLSSALFLWRAHAFLLSRSLSRSLSLPHAPSVSLSCALSLFRSLAYSLFLAYSLARALSHPSIDKESEITATICQIPKNIAYFMHGGDTDSCTHVSFLSVCITTTRAHARTRICDQSHGPHDGSWIGVMLINQLEVGSFEVHPAHTYKYSHVYV